MLALELAKKAWRTALQALDVASGAQASLAVLENRVVSPNDFNTNIIGNIAPIGAAIVAVVDITPKESGLLYVAGYFAADATSVGVDRITLEADYYPGLTGITGGTLIAPGLTTAQTHPITAVAASGAPVLIAREFQETAAPAGSLTGAWKIPFSFPVQAVKGQRTGVVFVLISANGRTFNNLQLCLDVTDQP